MVRRRRRKKGLHPLVAFALLAGSAAFAFLTLGGGTATAMLDDPGWYDDEDEFDEPGDSGAEEVRWNDLLAVHGSLGEDVAVMHAFADAPQVQLLGAVPLGETAPGAGRRWRGGDPPALRLGVVMVSLGSRRAVVDGRVLGIGDTIADAEVVAIERDLLRLRWRGRELTYDLEDEVPREFRAERDRRAALQAAADTNDEQGSEEDK